MFSSVAVQNGSGNVIDPESSRLENKCYSGIGKMDKPVSRY